MIEPGRVPQELVDHFRDVLERVSSSRGVPLHLILVQTDVLGEVLDDANLKRAIVAESDDRLDAGTAFTVPQLVGALVSIVGSITFPSVASPRDREIAIIEAPESYLVSLDARRATYVRHP